MIQSIVVGSPGYALASIEDKGHYSVHGRTTSISVFHTKSGARVLKACKF